MPQGNVSGLHAALMDVSDPRSPNYGQHLSKAEVEHLVAPSSQSVEAVTDWLSKNGISPASTSPSGDMLTIQITVEQANTLLDADFKPFFHDRTNTTVLRTLSYSLPESLTAHVSFIYPTTQFVVPSFGKKGARTSYSPSRAQKRIRHGRRADVQSLCAQEVSPQCLQALYNIPSTPATASGNGIGVTAFGNEFPDQQDLDQFLSTFRPDIANGTFSVQSIDGGITSGAGTGEASLDIQFTVGLATNVPVTLLSVGTDGQESDLDEINFLLAQENPPLVVSTSFGGDEHADVPGVIPVLERVCNAWAQLGARGVSVMFASGDGGVAGSSFDSDKDGACDGQPFRASFPSTCPFLTSVGSTQGVNPETAASFSSGGFSNAFPQPDYQTQAVQNYLNALGDTNAGRFNASGRAFPDVSTLGTPYPIVLNGKVQGAQGTSASCPTFASVIALVNDQLLNAGKPPLGFLNPFLYSKAAGAFNDITSGSNPGCGTQGFPALAGWDPVTGLGTPDFNKLLAIALDGTAPVQTV